MSSGLQVSRSPRLDTASKPLTWMCPTIHSALTLEVTVTLSLCAYRRPPLCFICLTCDLRKQDAFQSSEKSYGRRKCLVTK